MLSLFVVSGLAAPTAPLYPGVGAIFKGPDSETIIKGPDGSRITSVAEGAALATEEKLEPIVGPAAPVIPVAPVAVPEEKSTAEIKGPSGKISTDGESSVVSGPASATFSGPYGTIEAKAAPALAPLEAPEEIVAIAEQAVAAVPKAEAVIFALQEPQAVPVPEEPFGIEVEAEHEPFLIKEY